MMKLIGAIPFLASCSNPARTAFSHLTITSLASHRAGKDIFAHNFSDNSKVLKRLDPISGFNDGNRHIIRRGMILLAVIILSDHKKILPKTV